MSWWFSAAPGYLLRCVQMHEHAMTVTWTCWLHGWLPGGLDHCFWGGLRVTMAMEEHQPLCLSEGKELSCHLNPLSFSPCPLYPWQRSANYSLSGCFSGWVPPTLVSPKALDDVSPHSCLSIDELGLLLWGSSFPHHQWDCPWLCRGQDNSSGYRCSCWRTGTMKSMGDQAVALTWAPALMGSFPSSQGLPYPFIFVRANKERKDKRPPWTHISDATLSFS